MIGKGFVHVYTGNGKGKTTAALGLVLRACGAGLKVFVAQFLKSKDYSELVALQRFSDLVTVKQYGTGKFVRGNPSEEDRRMAGVGLREVKEALLSEEYQLVVLDEANVATGYKTLKAEDIVDLIRSKPEGVELVITGRCADPAVIENADLVTEMKEIKHYYRGGIGARKGIEK